jgi:hypothetical protein
MVIPLGEGKKLFQSKKSPIPKRDGALCRQLLAIGLDGSKGMLAKCQRVG